MANSLENLGLVTRARMLAVGFGIFFLLTWSAIFFPYNDLVDRFGAPLGGDFPMFYVAGQTVFAGQTEQLYDDAAQQERLHQQFSTLAADYILPFRYPHVFAFLLAPLAALTYPLAFAIFGMSMCLLWWSASWLLSKDLGGHEHQFASAALWLMLAWPIGWEAVIGGQASPIALMIVAGVWVLLRSQRAVLAGAVLAFAVYKPNVLAFFVLGCLLARPRMWFGALTVWALLICWTIATVGTAGLFDYVEYGSQLAVERWQQETPFWKVHGLGSVLSPFVVGNERILLLVLGCFLTALIVWRWRQSASHSTQARAMSSLLVVNFLCNPYVPIYDLLTIMAAMAIAAHSLTAVQLRGAISDRRWQAIILLLLAGPHISQMFARSIGFQMFPVIIGALCIVAAVLHQRRSWLMQAGLLDKNYVGLH